MTAKSTVNRVGPFPQSAKDEPGF